MRFIALIPEAIFLDIMGNIYSIIQFSKLVWGSCAKTRDMGSSPAQGNVHFFFGCLMLERKNVTQFVPILRFVFVYTS